MLDMDGVIVDSLPLHYRTTAQVFASRGHRLSRAEYNEFFAGVTDKEGFATFCKRIGESDASTLMAQKTALFAQLAANGAFAHYPDTLAAIRWLAANNVPLAVVTGSLRAEALHALQATGIQEILQAIITADDITHGKPHPEGYLKGARALGVAPADCVVIEDAPAGIDAALAAGMRCIALTNTYPRAALRNATRIVSRLQPSLFEQ